MRGARQGKKFAVVVWVRKTDTFNALREQLIAIAGDEPEESTEYEGMVDFHWRFESYAAAGRQAKLLQEITHKPEIVILRLASYDDETPSVTLKDTRRAPH